MVCLTVRVTPAVRGWGRGGLQSAAAPVFTRPRERPGLTSRRRGYRRRTLMVMALLSLLVIGELERTHLTL